MVLCNWVATCSQKL